jgi:hypothetical protein
MQKVSCSAAALLAMLSVTLSYSMRCSDGTGPCHDKLTICGKPWLFKASAAAVLLLTPAAAAEFS